jgi:ABC-type phosphate transport system substrate-binding protein
MNALRRSIAAATAAVVLGGAPAARAVDCSSLMSPVYVTGSTAAKPLLAEIGRILAGETPPVSIVYLGQGSCTGVDAILNGTPIMGAGTTALSYWDATGAEQKCDVATSTGGVVADVGISDVFATTCFQLPGGLPATVADTLGPVQTMTFVAPAGSPERSISAEAAYYVFGFGADSGVAPWTDETLIFHRDDQSGTQRMIATAIGVPPTKWKGVTATSSGDLLMRLMNASSAGPAIGILASDVAQDNRPSVRVLAYQHFGQRCGYYPDSVEIFNDKANVRDGHYAIWGPLHLLARINSLGYPVNPLAADVIGLLAGTTPAPPGLDLIMIEAQRHVVPQCAMHVRRVQELGPMMSFAPSGSCGCYYEKVANNGTTCQPCSAPLDCPSSAPVCSYGYCETQ